MSLVIQVYSDVVCPWCLLGKRRLERALDRLGLRETTALQWLPFELNPDMPEGGMERSAYRVAKFGRERADTLDREMTERGREEGVSFTFDRMARTPSTRRAHALLAFAGSQGRGDAVADALFRAYFEEARDVGEAGVLAEIAAAAGLDRDAAALSIADPALLREVELLEREGRRLGIAGVPFFIVEKRWAISGAQPAETWEAFLRDRMTERSTSAA